MQRLTKILKRLGSVVIGYSGGLDSTFLLKAAFDTLGRDKVLAVTARSETYPLSEYREAKHFARAMGVRHMTIRTSELGLPGFSKNPVNRCYYCKRELFTKLKEIAAKRGLSVVADGTNVDDANDIRHGRKAAEEIGVKSPLLEARLGKKEIRRLSKQLGLGSWKKAPFACLASRFPHHETIDRLSLGRVERAEEYMKTLGLRQIRVRVHKDLARIEVDPGELFKVFRARSDVESQLKKIGFRYVALDLAGYRTGNMNEQGSRADVS